MIDFVPTLAHNRPPALAGPRHVTALVIGGAGAARGERRGSWSELVRELELPTPADTERLGRAIGARLRAGDVVVLSGPLGAGKTVVARGIGAGLGVRGPVTSPTFVIAREHPPLPGGRGVSLVHVDAYRLATLAELDDLDFDTALLTAALVVEWGEGMAERLAAEHLLVRLDRVDRVDEQDRVDGQDRRESPAADETRVARLSGPARLIPAYRPTSESESVG